MLMYDSIADEKRGIECVCHVSEDVALHIDYNIVRVLACTNLSCCQQQNACMYVHIPTTRN